MKFELEDARRYAEAVVRSLKPFCEVCEIAGSVRRQKPLCSDIEVVCIPKRESDLLGVDCGVCRGFAGKVNSWGAIRGEPNDKYTRRKLPLLSGFEASPELDLFIARRSNFGWIFALRTGSAEFNAQYWLPRLRDAGYVSISGDIRRMADSSLVDVPDEAALFNLIKAEFVQPQQRNF